MKTKKKISKPRPTRRTRDEITTVKDAIHMVLAADAPCTVRQVFYRLVSEGVVRKTEGEYKATVVRLLGEMRRNHEIAFSLIADNTRWMRKPASYSSLESMLAYSAQAYRRSVWDGQDCYCEIWLEKDALAGVLYDVTEAWDVPLMVTRGYPSLSFLHTAAESIAAQGKPAHLYYFGDYDPSGLDIPRKIESDLRTFAPEAEIHFQRVAVNPDQIVAMSLPTRPTKKKDSRARGFIGESVEVDAIPPQVLRDLATDCITQHIDTATHNGLLIAEEGEREALMSIARQYEGFSGELPF